MFTLRSDIESDSSPEGGEIEAVLHGSLTLVEVNRRESACIVILRREAAPPLTVRERAVMERLVRGQSQKAIAYELGVALTTVSAHLRVGLDKLGLRRWEQAVLAGAVLERARRCREAHVADASGLVVFRAALCDEAMGALTPTEREVVLSVVDGGANQVIAKNRGVSHRTVANQVASVFRKLRVHGRLDLIRRLVVPSPLPLRLVVDELASPEFTWPEQMVRGGSSAQEPALVGE